MHEVKSCMWHMQNERPEEVRGHVCRDVKMLRAVIRIDVTLDMIEDLVKHISQVPKPLSGHATPCSPCLLILRCMPHAQYMDN